MLRIVRFVSLASTVVTLAALSAHALELPNKLALDGPLWLAVQQKLYRGWGPALGPFEVAAVVAAWAFAYLARARREVVRPATAAAALLTAALAVFFVLNAPVNAAFAAWTAATLPADWPSYRLRWELGHATSFLLFAVALGLLLHAYSRNADAAPPQPTASPAGGRESAEPPRPARQSPPR